MRNVAQVGLAGAGWFLFPNLLTTTEKSAINCRLQRVARLTNAVIAAPSSGLEIPQSECIANGMTRFPIENQSLQKPLDELQLVNEFPIDQVRYDVIDGTEEPVIPRAAGQSIVLARVIQNILLLHERNRWRSSPSPQCSDSG